MMKEQLFGIEIEFTGITRKMAADAVAEIVNGSVNGPDYTCYHTRVITDASGRKWKVMRDSSIVPSRSSGCESLDEYRVEFVTPPLSYEDIKTLQNIIRKFRGIGGTPNSSCGIHVHVDGSNHTPQSLTRLVNFMVSRQDLIYEALDIKGRGDRWCRKLNPQILTEMKRDRNLSREDAERIWYSSANDGYNEGINHEHYNRTRYHGINLHSFFTKGTVEFRLFNSTLHAGKVKAYIQFCLAMSAWAITSTGPVVFRSMKGYTSEQKVTIMRNILTHRLGLYGDEFKTCRLHLMTPLKKAAGMVSRAA